MVQSKKCLKCCEDLPLGSFNKHKRRPDGLQQTCRQCQKLYYASNKASILETQKAWAEANPEKVLGYKKAWKTANRVAVREYNKSYRKQNLPRYAYWASQRKLQKDQATPSWLSDEQKAQIKLFYEHSADCYAVSGQKYHVDHIVPIKGRNVCGLNVPWNLQILPSDLNEKKSNAYNDWQEWTPASC